MCFSPLKLTQVCFDCKYVCRMYGVSSKYSLKDPSCPFCNSKLTTIHNDSHVPTKSNKKSWKDLWIKHKKYQDSEKYIKASYIGQSRRS